MQAAAANAAADAADDVVQFYAMQIYDAALEIIDIIIGHIKIGNTLHRKMPTPTTKTTANADVCVCACVSCVGQLMFTHAAIDGLSDWPMLAYAYRIMFQHSACAAHKSHHILAGDRPSVRPL